MRFAKYLLAVMVLLFTAFFSLAQTDTNTDGAPEEQLQLALEDLSSRVGTTVTVNNVEYRWRGERFPDTSMGCPQPDIAYAQVLTPGYQFLIEYGGAVYDYRVSQDSTIVSLCSTVPVEQATLSPLTLTPSQNTATSEAETCTDSVTVAEGDTLMSLAELCGVTAGAIIDANTSLQTRVDLLTVGDVLQIPAAAPDDMTDESEAVVAIFPTTGEPGTSVNVIINGLTDTEEISIGLGTSATDFSIMESVPVATDGAVSTQITIPETAAAGENWMVIVTGADNTVQAVSVPFTVR